MAKCLRGLIFLSSLLTGSSGVDDAHVFISSGENVHLSCNNALPDCNSTTWLYNRFRDSVTVELIGLGMKNKNTERHERLSLGSDCSLNIKNITKEDYGSYTCQQFVNDKQQGTDAPVYLHVLHVSSSSSSSSSQTEISAGCSVTLSCQLYSYSYAGDSCEESGRSEEIQLFWLDQAGVKLRRSDSRYQILFSSGHCIITLNTTLLNEDHNRQWRCAVTHRDQLKTTSNVNSSDSTQIPVSSSNSEKKSSRTTAVAPAQDPAETEVSRSVGSLFRVIVIIVEFAVFAAPTVILLQIICARRAENKEKTQTTLKK